MDVHPQRKWPPAWKGRFLNPVVPQVLNIYGHPEAGLIWEEYFETIIFSLGFASIPNHRSCYLHASYRVLMAGHVDDIKIAGPAKSCEQVWKRLRAKVKTDEPTEPDGMLLEIV